MSHSEEMMCPPALIESAVMRKAIMLKWGKECVPVGSPLASSMASKMLRSASCVKRSHSRCFEKSLVTVDRIIKEISSFQPVKRILESSNNAPNDAPALVVVASIASVTDGCLTSKPFDSNERDVVVETEAEAKALAGREPEPSKRARFLLFDVAETFANGGRFLGQP